MSNGRGHHGDYQGAYKGAIGGGSMSNAQRAQVSKSGMGFHGVNGQLYNNGFDDNFPEIKKKVENNQFGFLPSLLKSFY